jgi:carbon monoxide dehydrogenase subunit G
MAHYSTTVRTPMSPTDAFAYTADIRNFSDWDPGVTKVRQQAGDGPSTGAAYDVTVQGFPKNITMRYDMTLCEQPNRVELISQTATLRSVDTITVEPEGDGAKVTYEADLTLRGPLALFDPLLRLVFNRIGDRAAEGLRKALRAAP